MKDSESASPSEPRIHWLLPWQCQAVVQAMLRHSDLLGVGVQLQLSGRMISQKKNMQGCLRRQSARKRRKYMLKLAIGITSLVSLCMGQMICQCGFFRTRALAALPTGARFAARSKSSLTMSRRRRRQKGSWMNPPGSQIPAGSGFLEALPRRDRRVRKTRANTAKRFGPRLRRRQ